MIRSSKLVPLMSIFSILFAAALCDDANGQIRWKRRIRIDNCLPSSSVRRVCVQPTFGAKDSGECLPSANWGHEFRSLGRIWRYHTVRGTSPDGTKLILCIASKEFAIYDLTAGRVTQSFEANESIFDAAFSPDGKTIAVAEWRDGFTLRDANTLAVIDSFKGSGNLGAWQARFTASGDQLMLYSWWHNQKQFWRYDLNTRSESGWPSHEQIDSPNLITRERFAASGNHLFSVRRKSLRGRATDFQIWTTDPETGERRDPRVLDERDLFQFDLSPDGQRVILMKPGEDARLVDMDTGVDVAWLGGHDTWVSAAAFSPDGNYTVSAGGSRAVSQGGHLTTKRPPKDAKNRILVHDARTGATVAVLSHLDTNRNYKSVGFSRDSRYVWAITRDQEVVLWGDLPSIPNLIEPLPHADESDRK